MAACTAGPEFTPIPPGGQASRGQQAGRDFGAHAATGTHSGSPAVSWAAMSPPSTTRPSSMPVRARLACSSAMRTCGGAGRQLGGGWAVFAAGSHAILSNNGQRRVCGRVGAGWQAHAAAVEAERARRSTKGQLLLHARTTSGGRAGSHVRLRTSHPPVWGTTVTRRASESGFCGGATAHGKTEGLTMCQTARAR